MISINEHLTIYIGYDPREHAAYEVCKSSILRRANPHWRVSVQPVCLPDLQDAGVYTRTFAKLDGQMYDDIDKKPFSTEFSFSRFLVPYLNNYRGWALFMDCDMAMCVNPLDVFNDLELGKAVHVAKLNYSPGMENKMDNQIQSRYDRKNWSSFMLFDCGHRAFKLGGLTPEVVNKAEGNFLHQFTWLDAQYIGELDEAWNILVDEKGIAPWDTFKNPKNFHWTLGGPWFSHHSRCGNNEFWYTELSHYTAKLADSMHNIYGGLSRYND